MIVVESYRKYLRSIAGVYINFIVFEHWKAFANSCTMARVRSNGKRIWRLIQAEVVNDSGCELGEVPPKHCESVYWFFSVVFNS